MSKTTTVRIKDIDMIKEPPHPNAISRLKKHIKDVQVKWGPLMAAKEDVFDEYNFPPGRYAGQGMKETHNGEHWREVMTLSKIYLTNFNRYANVSTVETEL
jgi:hypothetical protein